MPVPGALLPKNGASGDFIYKRREDHYHQGLDIGTNYDPATATLGEAEYQRMRLAGELPILSVLDGKVVAVRNETKHDGGGGYGRLVVVQSKTDVLEDGQVLWLLYSHCSRVLCGLGQQVFAGQTIARVGWSGNAGRKNPHLHFEVADDVLPTKKGDETTPFEERRRIDPRRLLSRLPSFSTRVFVPRHGKPSLLKATHIAKLHGDIETSTHGGYFPLGANNTWHGGVHLPFADADRLFCPLDGQIVAARLDPDPATSTRQHGSTNFILVRHELSSRLHHQLRGTQPEPPVPGGGGGSTPSTKKHGVGGKYDNDPELLERARDALSAQGHYPLGAEVPQLEAGSIEPALLQAIESFQASLNAPASFDPWPDGSMKFGGFTWEALFEGSDEGGPTHPDDDTDPDPPSEPAADDNSHPSRPPPAPEDPKRVVYSLFMHLAAETFTDKLAERFGWLKNARLFHPPKNPPSGLEADIERARRHREDVAESGAHRLTKHVGKGDENPQDVQWVRMRLVRFEMLSSDSGSGVLGEELLDAILRFQKEHVYRKDPSKADGVISKGRRTDIFLRKSRRQLGIDPVGAPLNIDPLLRALLSERGVDGMTGVLSGLSVPVQAGDALWSPGQAAGFTEDGQLGLGQRVHWEMFSEHPMFVEGHAQWDSIVDPNEDLTADAPRALMDLVADWPVGTGLDDLPPDGIIDTRELAAFYAEPASNFLRRRQCQFRTEWGLDLDASITRLKAQGWAGADGLRASLLPYQWWFDAADVLPASTHVWHYNPVEFLAACHEALESLKPPPPKSREDYGSVRIRVVNHRGGPAVGTQVQVIDAQSVVHTKMTDAPSRNGSGGGTVDFGDVRAGPCQIVLSQEGRAHPIETEIIRPGWDANAFRIKTAFEGPEPSRGAIRATVRQFGTRYKTPVEVQLVDAGGAVVQRQTSAAATLLFEGVVLGEYVLRSTDGESEPSAVTLDRSRTVKTVVRRKPEPARLMVTVLYKGAPASRTLVRVTLAADGGLAAGGLGQTDTDGRCVFQLRRGRHHVRVGRKKKFVNLIVDRADEVLLEVERDLLPEEPFGVLHVKVGSPVKEAQIPVSIVETDNPAVVLHERYLDPAGELVVRLPSGEYAVFYDGREATGSIHGGTYNTVEL